MSGRRRILILCTGNSARSQMAEGLVRHDSGDVVDVYSAGTQPGAVRPEAVTVMRELGIDISGHRSKHVEEFAAQHFDLVLTVCDNARDSCPLFTNTATSVHHSFEDPAAAVGTEAERLHVYRRVRDQLRQYLRELLRRNDTP